jgi:hypothetical protein
MEVIMKHVKNNPASTNRKRIEKYVKELSALEEKCRLLHSRDWFIPYLKRVYELYMNWRKRKLSKQRRADLDQFILKRRSRKDQKSLHLIIKCTSTANPKTRNHWAHALLAARSKSIDPKTIPDFLLNKGNGGLKGRSAEYTKHMKRQKKKSKKAGKHNKFSVSHKTSPHGTGGNANRATGSVVSRKNDNEGWGID